MSDVIIRARGLTKIYRLYSKPYYRFLDMFGLLGNRPGAYSEHAALNGIDLEVFSGEKVAIIGRNGAGKSTLLKLVTNVIEPTSGTIATKSGAYALLQLGAGFHPEFTGRENVVSYLAHLGVSTAETKRKMIEVIEFSELEEYIDQPIKTYSTGMVARLMFSTSTAVIPRILVLDEILGVGDAYFAHKSYERIKELCSGSGTTLLLVTHDIYGASRLCERMVWIDRGQVVIDGASPTVIKAYEDSIRAQEEIRLRKKKQNRLRQAFGETSDSQPRFVLVEISSRHNLPLPCPIYFSDISLRLPDGAVLGLPLLATGQVSEKVAHLQLEASSWGRPEAWQGRDSRALRDHGSPFHKAGGVFPLPERYSDSVLESMDLHLEYCSTHPCDLILRAFVGDQEVDLGCLPPSEGQWLAHTTTLRRVPPGERQAQPVPEINLQGVHGSGTILVKDIRAYNHRGEETFHLAHGMPMSLRIDYEIKQKDLVEKAQVLIAFHKDGVQDICRIITRDLCFDSSRITAGTIWMRMPKLMLGNGTYTVSLMLAKEGYYDKEQTVFYSINPSVYTCLTKVIEIVVVDAGYLGTGTGFIGEADWSISASAPSVYPSLTESKSHD